MKMLCHIFLLTVFILRVSADGGITQFGEPMSNLSILVGQNASFKCVIHNLGEHKVSWVYTGRRPSEKINRIIETTKNRFEVSYDSKDTWGLSINPVEPEDRGNYLCQVNTQPIMSQVAHLQILIPPSFFSYGNSESRVGVHEYKDVSLTCRAQGVPRPRITWKRKDGKRFTHRFGTNVSETVGETLQFFKVLRSQMGEYLCTASNGIQPSASKTILLDVKFEGRLWVPNQLIRARKGMDVTMECYVKASPSTAESSWVFEKNPIVSNSSKYLMITEEAAENQVGPSYKTHMKLQVRQLTEADFGTYSCASRSSAGETVNIMIELKELKSPRSASGDGPSIRRRSDFLEDDEESALEGSGDNEPPKDSVQVQSECTPPATCKAQADFDFDFDSPPIQSSGGMSMGLWFTDNSAIKCLSLLFVIFSSNLFLRFTL